MAGVKLSATVVDEALTASNTETVVQLVAAANHPIKVTGFSISFAGTSNTEEPIRVDLIRQTSAGTSSALTPLELTITGTTLQTTARQDVSSEPTGSDVVWTTRVHPQSGAIYDFPFEEEIQVASTLRLGLVVITPAGVNPNCSACLKAEE